MAARQTASSLLLFLPAATLAPISVRKAETLPRVRQHLLSERHRVNRRGGENGVCVHINLSRRLATTNAAAW